LAQAAPCGAVRNVALGAKQFRVIERESGPLNYYRVVDEGSQVFLRAEYKPPAKTTVLGIAVADAHRERARTLSWAWRALKLPHNGDECAEGRGDSAAVVYASWKRALRWYTLKYVWSSVGTRGRVCDKKRNPFAAQDTVILQSGGPTGRWQHQHVDLRAEFRKHFEDGDPNADVPDFVGVAIMSDGDQTRSESAADYGKFVLGVDPVCAR
jgi:hypothetical protein